MCQENVKRKFEEEEGIQYESGDEFSWNEAV